MQHYGARHYGQEGTPLPPSPTKTPRPSIPSLDYSGPSNRELLGYVCARAGSFLTTSVKKISEPLFLSQMLPLYDLALVIGSDMVVEMPVLLFVRSFKSWLANRFPDGRGVIHLSLIIFRASYVAPHCTSSLAHTVAFVCGRVLPQTLLQPIEYLEEFNKVEVYGTAIGSNFCRVSFILASTVVYKSSSLSIDQFIYLVTLSLSLRSVFVP